MIDPTQHPISHGHHLEKDPSVMVRLFSKMPLHTELFVIKPLDMKETKVNLPSQVVRSNIHCFVFITGGEALITIGEKSYFFRPDECATIPAGQIFSIRYFDGCTGYMGGFSNEFMSSGFEGRNLLQNFSILRCWGGHKVRFEAKHAAYISNLMDRMVAENSDGNNKKIIKAYLTSLLTELEEQSQQTTGDIIPVDNDLCNRFIELAFNECNHSIPLSDYADKLNITKGYLHKTVNRFTGKTPLTWIAEAIVMEAKVLLSQTETTIGEISSILGFEDSSYFSRFFKKHTLLSPVDYRKHSKIQI